MVSLHPVYYFLFLKMVCDLFEEGVKIDTAATGEESTFTSSSLSKLVFVATLLKELIDFLHSDFSVFIGLLVLEELVYARDLVFRKVGLHPAVLLDVEVGVHRVASLGVAVAHT